MHIVIAGGGFGGVKTAIELAENKDFQITLVSDKDHFLYYPALYGTATGRSHLESSVMLRSILKDYSNIRLEIDTVQHLNVERKQLISSSGKTYHYDRLVIALGVVTTYFGIEGLDQYAYSIKSIAEVRRFKSHLHNEMTDDHQMDKNYVVVGAGPTGVELSAALSTYLRRIAQNHGVKHDKITIDLIEAAPRILPRMSEAASTKVARRLQKLKVNVMTNKKVEGASADSLMVSGHKIPSKTVVWTSGVANHPFFKENVHCFNLAKNGRVEVDSFMMAAKNVYVIGDNANTPYCGLAQTALHDALYVASNLKRELHAQPPKYYKPKLPPVVVPVGENWAIFEWGPFRFGGLLGALLRRAADFIGYNDVLPIGQALGVWRAQYLTEEECEICQQAAIHGPMA